jgi:hypothetical protein
VVGLGNECAIEGMIVAMSRKQTLLPIKQYIQQATQIRVVLLTFVPLD